MQLFIDYSTEQSNKYFKSYLTLSKYLIIRYFLIFLYILNIKIMLAKFRALASIQRFSNALLEKGKFAFCSKQNLKNIAINYQIIACQNSTQLQKIFHKNRKEMDFINFKFILRKDISLNSYKNEIPQNNFLIKSILVQMQNSWHQFMSDWQDSQNIIQLLTILYPNKIYDLNHKIMELDLLQVFNNTNQNKKGILLNLIIGLNLQTQFDQKYAGLKGQILGNAEYIRSSHIKVKDLIGQNIINILVYSISFVNLRFLVSLWRKIIIKKLDTKFFNNYMVQNFIKSAQIKNKEDQLTLKYYIHLLKAIQSVKHDIQNKDIEKIIKNYPKNAQDISKVQIYIFYQLIKYLPQLKQFIQYQLQLSQTKLNEDKQSQQNQINILKLFQKFFIKHFNMFSLKLLGKIAWYLSTLNYHTAQLVRQIQQAAIKMIKKQGPKCNIQQLCDFINNIVKDCKGKNFQQIEYFYRQIFQFLIQQNLDQFSTKHLIFFISLLSKYIRKIQSTKSKNLLKREIFGNKDRLLQKFYQTLRNPERALTIEDILIIIENLIRINIVNQDVCEFIKKKIQTFQETQRDQKQLKQIKNLKNMQNLNNCSLGIKYCKCKCRFKSTTLFKGKTKKY